MLLYSLFRIILYHDSKKIPRTITLIKYDCIDIIGDNAKRKFIPRFLRLLLFTSRIERTRFSSMDASDEAARREHGARARDSDATGAPSVNERERKAFEGRRPAGRAESLGSRANQCAFPSAICASVRGSGVTGISDVCLPVRRRRVTAVSIEVRSLQVRCCLCVDFSRSNRSVWRTQRPSEYIHASTGA